MRKTKKALVILLAGKELEEMQEKVILLICESHIKGRANEEELLCKASLCR